MAAQPDGPRPMIVRLAWKRKEKKKAETKNGGQNHRIGLKIWPSMLELFVFSFLFSFFLAVQFLYICVC
jgi:hypothetical protein